MLLTLLSISYGFSQETYDINYQDKPLEDVFIDMTLKHQVLFKYRDEWVRNKRVSASESASSLEDALNIILRGTGLSYELIGYLVIILDEAVKVEVPQHSVQGVVRSVETGLPVPGASVLFREQKIGVSSDPDGNFEAEVPYGQHSVVVKSVSTLDQVINLFVASDTILEIDLYDKVIELDGVTVTGQRADENVQAVTSGMETIDIQSIRSVPAFMGEVDVTRTVTSMTGVSSVGEGSSGFNVRGGNIDQNLILLDGIPIFNSSHLLGFFSVFNPDMVSNFSLFKGVIPASHGGRLSALLNVDQFNPNKERLVLESSVGVITNKVKADIPLVAGKTGAVIGFRNANPSLLLSSANQNDQIKNSSAKYYDLNARVQHIQSQKDNFSASFYTSGDEFSFFGDSTYRYESLGASGRWNHSFGSRISSYVQGFYSKYTAGLEDRSAERLIDIENGIEVSGAKANLSYFQSENLVIDGGVSTNFYTTNPGKLTPLNGSAFRTDEIPEDQAVQIDFYAMSEVNLWRLSLNMGIRYNIFQNLPSKKFIYQEGLPKAPSTVVDSTSAGQTYTGLEPRISGNLSINRSTSLKFGYGVTRQYIHLYSNSTASLPTDVWMLSDINILPQSGESYNAGLFKNFRENLYEVSVEGFYRTFTNTAEVEPGTEVLMNESLEADLLRSRGRSYGTEFSLSKTRGQFNGAINYTISRSFRQINSKFNEELLNQGDYFPANFDRPHDLNVNINWQPRLRWTFSSVFVHSSGRPVTIPNKIFNFQGTEVYISESQNNFRIPPTTRLDVAVTIAGTYKRDPKFEHSFTFSIYNALGFDNPYSLFVRPTEDGIKLFKLTVLNSAFPAITYNIKFNGKKR